MPQTTTIAKAARHTANALPYDNTHKTVPRVEMIDPGTRKWWRAVVKDDSQGFTTVAPFDTEEEAIKASKEVR